MYVTRRKLAKTSIVLILLQILYQGSQVGDIQCKTTHNNLNCKLYYENVPVIIIDRRMRIYIFKI